MERKVTAKASWDEMSNMGAVQGSKAAWRAIQGSRGSLTLRTNMGFVSLNLCSKL